jgi:hypothetical protein
MPRRCLRAATLNVVDVAIAPGHFARASFPMIPGADVRERSLRSAKGWPAARSPRSRFEGAPLSRLVT